LPKQYESEWNRFDADVFYHYVRDEQIPSAVAQAAVDFVIDAHVFSGGRPDVARAVAEFKDRFSRDLTPNQIQALTSWYLDQRS
jgi:hypothetical protein